MAFGSRSEPTERYLHPLNPNPNQTEIGADMNK
jgi:hypothetical protein